MALGLPPARVTASPPRARGSPSALLSSAGWPPSSFPPAQQQHPLQNSRFGASLAESPTEGNVFGQLDARRTLAPQGLGLLPAHKGRSCFWSQNGKSHRRGPLGWSAGFHLPAWHTQKPFPFLWRPGCLASDWQLLTEWGPSIEEVGHHLAFALDLDHTPALQLVGVGSQHLVHVCCDLRKQRRREDRPSVT